MAGQSSIENTASRDRFPTGATVVVGAYRLAFPTVLQYVHALTTVTRT